MALMVGNVDLETTLIHGNQKLGAGRVAPNKVYGTIPNPAPLVRGGGIFTPATYRLPNINPGTPLQVTLENETYLNSATLMVQMYQIYDSINYDNEIPTDAEITANTNQNLLNIHKKAIDLFGIYGVQPGVGPVPRVTHNRRALNTYIFDPLNQTVVGTPIQGNLLVHLDAIGTPVTYGVPVNSKTINYLENHLVIYDSLRGGIAAPANTVLENAGRFDSYFFNGIISVDGRNLPAGHNFRQDFCPHNNPFNMAQINQIHNVFSQIYTPLRTAGLKVQDVSQTIRAITNPVITKTSRKNSARLFSVPTVNPDEYNQYYCVFSEDRALPSDNLVINNPLITNAGRKLRYDILRNVNTNNLIFDHNHNQSNAAITTYYYHILNTFETMYQYERINGINTITW